MKYESFIYKNHSTNSHVPIHNSLANLFLGLKAYSIDILVKHTMWINRREHDRIRRLRNKIRVTLSQYTIIEIMVAAALVWITALVLISSQLPDQPIHGEPVINPVVNKLDGEQPMASNDVPSSGQEKSVEAMDETMDWNNGLLTEDEWIEYLLGPWATQQFVEVDHDWKGMVSSISNNTTFENCLYCSHLTAEGHVLHQEKGGNAGKGVYVDHMSELLKRHHASDHGAQCKGKEIILRVGDNKDNMVSFPYFAKSRGVEGGAILLQMNKPRHWAPVRPLLCTDTLEPDRKWEDKKAVAVWRGASNGIYELRGTFVKQYGALNADVNKIDVGFTTVWKKHYTVEQEKESKQFVKASMSKEELLSHKFVISIEGNDVATNFKWVMASNSVPFAPKPTAETWGLEGTFRAGVHYVELVWNDQDGWDLEEKIRFCIEHDAKCKEIAQNGRLLMEHYRFCDEEYQQELELKIMDRYCEQVSIHLK